MTHPDMEAQVDAYLDGELAASDAVELEAHLAGCATCGRFRDDRLALRTAIAARDAPARGPGVLAGTCARRAARGGRTVPLPAVPPRLLAWRWLAFAASIAVVAIGSWRLAVVQHRLVDPG